MILILNAPPQSGKDLITTCLSDSGQYVPLSFKAPLFEAAIALSGIPMADFMQRYTDREFKEVPWDLLGGKSCRTFLQFVSEKVLKPLYGEDVMGKRLLQAIQATPNYQNTDFVISDGGFAGEIVPLLQSGIPVTIARLHRDGCTFKGDTRSYIYPGTSTLVSFDYTREEDCWASDAQRIHHLAQLLMKHSPVTHKELE